MSVNLDDRHRERSDAIQIIVALRLAALHSTMSAATNRKIHNSAKLQLY
jgi:hypothetical protein